MPVQGQDVIGLYIYRITCVALYIIPETHSFLGVLFSLGLLSSSNPVRIWTITDSVPLARLSHTFM